MVSTILITLFGASATEPCRTILMNITNSKEYGREPSEEIIPYIEKVRADNGYTKLLTGDSVCHQLFNPFQQYNEVYCTAGSNQAVTMIGQYLLIRQFLESHPEATDVYLVLQSLTGTGLADGALAYQYLVIPFSETGLLQNVTEQTKNDLIYKYGAFFVKPEVVRFIDYSPIAKKLFLNSYKNVEYDSDGMSFAYLELIMDMCEEYGGKLHLIHCPMRESSVEVMQQQKMRDLNACTNVRMQLYVESYYASIVYYPDAYFSDGTHFGTGYSEEYQLAEYICDIMKKEDSLSDFVLR